MFLFGAFSLGYFLFGLCGFLFFVLSLCLLSEQDQVSRVLSAQIWIW